jgi:hypothetical protein
MKTLIASIFALTLLGATAANADGIGVGAHVGGVGAGVHVGGGDDHHYRHCTLWGWSHRRHQRYCRSWY